MEQGKRVQRQERKVCNDLQGYLSTQSTNVNRMQNSIPKSTINHPWRKRNDGLLRKYSIRNLRKEGHIKELNQIK